MLVGIASEPRAANAYNNGLTSPVNVNPCGLVISRWSPWLAVRPDRKVYDPSRYPVLGLLEIKCPQVSTVLDAKFLQRTSDGRLQLKRSHQYYTQVQAQLAITGLEWCNFYVWCEGDDHRGDMV
ncbi:hypothetical protein LSH36_1413g00023 [Paralvinella palmiformis]|uniref:YqaJ viral recombinase domain-containing protein n=1 Tax=Paralvinella palmiformis TaxID=53620 RepID=A0AAD9MN96_9ANNE|nr:hypothetical protein LSH36_1413g00023 [Paralvinella palmiformis]